MEDLPKDDNTVKAKCETTGLTSKENPMTMKNKMNPTSLTACLVLIGIAGAAAAEEIPAWATEQLLTPWYEAFNSQDAERLADIYTSDARVGKSSGRDEIIASFEADWADTDISCSGAYDGFNIVGWLAVGRGHDNCTETPKAGGTSKVVHSRWIAVYERQADGSWLCSRDIGEQVSYIDGFRPAVGHWSVDEEHRATPDAPPVKARSEWDINVMRGNDFVDTSGSRTFSSGEIVRWVEVWGVDPRNNQSFQHFVDTSGSFGNGSFEWVGSSWRSTVDVVTGDGKEASFECILTFSNDYNTFDGTCNSYSDGKSWVAYNGKGKRTE